MKIFEDAFLNNIVNSILIIIFMWACYFIITGFTKRFFLAGSKIANEKKSITIMKLVNSIIKYVIIVLGILMILGQFGFDTKGLIASLGIVGVIGGLALKDVVSSFIAGFSIITDNQYEVGDYVKIGDFKGTVIELSLQSTKIVGPNNELKIIANGTINEVINYSKKPFKFYLDIPVGYDIKKEKIEKILNEICEEVNQKVTYLKSDMILLGIQEFESSAITYRLSAEMDATKQFEFKRYVYGITLSTFEKNKIEIPYEQLVIHSE